MAYQRAVSSLGCPDASLEQVLALARRHALDAVELRALKGHIDLPIALGGAYGTPADLAGLDDALAAAARNHWW